MAEPSEWALQKAGSLILYGPNTIDAMNANTVRVALALDATRKEALEEAAEECDVNASGARHNGFREEASMAMRCAAYIRALVDKPPAPPADDYAQYQDVVSKKWVKISRRAGRIIARQLEPFEGVPIYEPPADD